MEEELKVLLETTLGFPVGISANAEPTATYEFYMRTGEQFGDGKCENEADHVQVDIWCKNKNGRDQLADKVHDVLKAQQYYTYPELERYFDEIAKRFRATFKFKIIR